MSYIITDDKHYKNIANSIRSKMQTDREYYPEDMAKEIDKIPSSADGTDNPVTGIYFLNPNDNGYPTKIKVSGYKLKNKETPFPLVFYDEIFSYIEDVEFMDCDFKYFQSYVFKQRYLLKSVKLPDNLTTINDNAFINCGRLTTINFPDSLTTIKFNAFRECYALTTVKLSDSLITLDSYAFVNCINLTTINFPSSIRDIAATSFQGCKILKEVTIGDGFNAENLDLAASTLYTRETILQWLNALADRTGQTAYKLTIGATNLAKLTEEDILIATNKNWTLA